jgi:hypothetical protein
VIIRLSKTDFVDVLPQLLRLWPKTGSWSPRRRALLRLALRDRTAPPSGGVVINERLSLGRLRAAGERLATHYSRPWKYQKYFNKKTPLRQQALVMRPGSTIPIGLAGVETTAYVNGVRRIQRHGKTHFLKMDLTVDTEHIAVVLSGESKCTCVYCGTKPIGEETSCRACGAPLPDC